MATETTLRNRKQGTKESVGTGTDVQASKTTTRTRINTDKLQVAFAAGFLVTIALLDRFSMFHPYTTKFMTLQHQYENGKYDIGWDDPFVVVSLIAILTLTRSFLLEYVFKPLASSRFKIHSRKAKQRFAEQGWSLLYYTFSWSLGFYLYYNSPYLFSVDRIYIGWPHDQLDPLFKLYYLVQTASWLQQIVVLNIEERRKDHYQMFAHHIITVCLSVGSYYYYFNRIGHVILILMDIVDVFLAAAKMLKYCGYSTACDFMFVMFMLGWVILRHGVYNYIFYKSWYYSMDLMTTASQCTAGFIQKRCWTPGILDVFLGLLAGLQVITIIWMYLIIKVLIKVITGKGAEDVRSDDED